MTWRGDSSVVVELSGESLNRQTWFGESMLLTIGTNESERLRLLDRLSGSHLVDGPHAEQVILIAQQAWHCVLLYG